MKISERGWSKLNRFLLSAGTLNSVDEMNSWILENISSLIPYDNSGIHITISGKLKPDIAASVNSEKKWEDLFNSYYYSVSLFPEFDRNIFYADNREIRGSHTSEYYNDFLLPQKIRYTAGFTLYSSVNMPAHTIVINRTGKAGMFSSEELAVMKITANHISNYIKMLSISEQFRTIPVMISELEKGNTILSARETEIVSLLVKRFKPEAISKELKISPLTVRKHIQNIYEKLNVTDRHQLFQKIHQEFKK